jgi:HD superfamily phosphodiesterase
MNDVRNILEARFPGLHARIEKMLVEAEAAYNRRAHQPPSDFLLDHTRRTAAIAYKISRMEGVDPFLPVVVALFHDSGKFYEGEYHKDETPEEEHAAVLAGKMLIEFGVGRSDIETVQEALRSMYCDEFPSIGCGRIVQDADQLDKLGALGVGAFFTKAALRGRSLVNALLQTASRELTYALAAPQSMYTETGKKLAQRQGAKTVAFFDELLDDLESWGIASFDRHTIVLEEDFRTRNGDCLQRMEVTIVTPRACPDCETSLGLSHWRGRGVKCEELTARFACEGCGYARETSFCLPVLA